MTVRKKELTHSLWGLAENRKYLQQFMTCLFYFFTFHLFLLLKKVEHRPLARWSFNISLPSWFSGFLAKVTLPCPSTLLPDLLVCPIVHNTSLDSVTNLHKSYEILLKKNHKEENMIALVSRGNGEEKFKACKFPILTCT